MKQSSSKLSALFALSFLLPLLGSCAFTQSAMKTGGRESLGTPGPPSHAWVNPSSFTFRLEYNKEGKTRTRHAIIHSPPGKAELVTTPETHTPLKILLLPATSDQSSPPQLAPDHPYPLIVVLQPPNEEPMTFLCSSPDRHSRIRFPTTRETPGAKPILVPTALVLDTALTPITIPFALFSAVWLSS